MTYTPTAQRITVIAPGEKYRPSCNRCGWESTRYLVSLGAARDEARAHAATQHGCSA